VNSCERYQHCQVRGVNTSVLAGGGCSCIVLFVTRSYVSQETYSYFKRIALQLRRSRVALFCHYCTEIAFNKVSNDGNDVEASQSLLSFLSRTRVFLKLPGNIILYRSNDGWQMFGGREGNRRSGVALAMCHRLNSIISTDSVAASL